MQNINDFKKEISSVWSFPERGNWATHNPNYRGNFAPQLARNVILRYSKGGDIVLDPMVGGGTTLIEANKKLSSRIEKTSNLIEDTLKSYGLKSIEETEVHKKSLEEKQNAQDEKVESLAEKINPVHSSLTGFSQSSIQDLLCLDHTLPSSGPLIVNTIPSLNVTKLI